MNPDYVKLTKQVARCSAVHAAHVLMIIVLFHFVPARCDVQFGRVGCLSIAMPTTDDGVPTSATSNCKSPPSGMSVPTVTTSMPLKRFHVVVVTDTGPELIVQVTDGWLVSTPHGFSCSSAVSLAFAFFIVHDR